MSQDPLRQACEDVASQLYAIDQSATPSNGKPNGWDELWMNALLAFAKAQRAAGVREIIEKLELYDGSFDAVNEEGCLEFSLLELIEWLQQRARELEKPQE